MDCSRSDTPLSVHQVESRDEDRIRRWLEQQTNVHIRFDLNELSDWLGTHQGFVAARQTETVGLILYASTSSTHVSLIGLAISDAWRTHQPDVLTVLFQNTSSVLRRRGFSTITCVTVAEWVQIALSRYLGFEPAGKLASYRKSDWSLPKAGNTVVRIDTASSGDGRSLLGVDKVAFPPLWQLDEHSILSSLRQNGYLLKAEWQGALVGYASGTWSQQQGHINRLAVHPQVQGLGIGHRLLAESLVRFHRAGIYQITLNTQADNLASRRLYERFGFRLVHCDAQVLARTV